MIREESPVGLMHPEMVAGRRLWLDSAMAELIRKLHEGDPTRGWAGDARLAVYWDGPTERWEVMRLEHDGEYRLVCRSKPGVPFDERLIDALVANDRQRAGLGLGDRIVAHNRGLDGRREAERAEYLGEEVAPRLRHALRKEL